MIPALTTEQTGQTTGVCNFNIVIISLSKIHLLAANRRAVAFFLSSQKDTFIARRRFDKTLR